MAHDDRAALEQMLTRNQDTLDAALAAVPAQEDSGAGPG